MLLILGLINYVKHFFDVAVDMFYHKINRLFAIKRSLAGNLFQLISGCV